MTLAGVPEKHIMQVTGHKTRHTLDRYNITVERDTHNTLQQTQEYLKSRKHGQKSGHMKMGTVTCKVLMLKMPEVGIEPTQGCPHGILRILC